MHYLTISDGQLGPPQAIGNDSTSSYHPTCWPLHCPVRAGLDLRLRHTSSHAEQLTGLFLRLLLRLRMKLLFVMPFLILCCCHACDRS